MSILLLHECMIRIASGKAEMKGAREEVEMGALPATEYLKPLDTFLRWMYSEKGRWAGLMCHEAFSLCQAIENKLSLHSTTSRVGCLGDSLEASGCYEDAALMYAETAICRMRNLP